MFQHLHRQPTRIVLCALALLLTTSPALAQRRGGGQERSSELRVAGERAQALLKTTVENFETTELKIKCGDEWIDILGGGLDDDTALRILEWTEWLGVPKWVSVTSTTAIADLEVQKDVIEAIEIFSGAKADALCAFLKELGVIGLVPEDGSCPQARAWERSGR